MRYAYLTIRKDELLRIFIGILIAVFILSLEGGALADDAVVCGDTISRGETVTLRGDLGPCVDDPVLTVEGPARLNLNGFTLTCIEKNNDGIFVIGERAIIHNGTVRGCKNAVHVRGDGHHQIVNLTVDDNENGIRVRSDKNHVVNNTATNNERGIRVQNDDNNVINNFADGNEKGVRVDGDNNNVVGNEANNNSAENFQIRGDNNRLVNNTANGGPEECFLIEGKENQLGNNYATGCLDGIVLEGAVDNYISHNTALNNVRFDLRDDNCDNNIWKKNNFETSDGICIE